MRRPTLALLALAVVAALGATSVPSSAAQRSATQHQAGGKKVAATGKAPTAKLFEIGHAAGEPTLGITKEGWVAITASDGCVTSCAGDPETLQTVAPGGRAVFLTKDRGKSWSNISPGVGDVSPHVASLDPYLLVDRSGETARIFDIDLNAACNILSYSDDAGATWVTNPLSCGEPVNDHQTLFVGKPVTSTTLLYPKVVYYCFNKLAYLDCTKSLDGGITFVPTGNAAYPECSGLHGHGVSDSKGTIYLPYEGCQGTPSLAVSRDEGATWSTIRLPGKMSSGGDPSVAVDSKDNLYFLYESSDRRPLLTTSTNGGKTWRKALDVGMPGVKRMNLSTLTVGAPGKVAFAYYGTAAESDKQAFWNGYLGMGTGLLGNRPTFWSASVNDPKHPLKTGACGPGRCGRVLDFIDVEIAPDGTPWAAYVDACAAVCEKTHVESVHDNDGVVGALFGGPNLRR